MNTCAKDYARDLGYNGEQTVMVPTFVGLTYGDKFWKERRAVGLPGGSDTRGKNRGKRRGAGPLSEGWS